MQNSSRPAAQSRDQLLRATRRQKYSIKLHSLHRSPRDNTLGNFEPEPAVLKDELPQTAKGSQKNRRHLKTLKNSGFSPRKSPWRTKSGWHPDEWNSQIEDDALLLTASGRHFVARHARSPDKR